MPTQTIVPFLWFDREAEEAARYYVSLFKRSKLGEITRYGEGAPLPKGTVLTVTFTLEGQEFVALNGGPVYKFTPAISLLVRVKTQKEVDHLYDSLASGGQRMPCAWVTDPYGVTWQIVPELLHKLIFDRKHPDKARRAMGAMMQMQKIDLAAIQKAYAGK